MGALSRVAAIIRPSMRLRRLVPVRLHPTVTAPAGHLQADPV